MAEHLMGGTQLTVSRRQHTLKCRVGIGAVLASLVVVLVWVFWAFPQALSPATLYLAAVASVLICLATMAASVSYWRTGLLLWWFLLSSEQIFSRTGVGEQQALAGAFSIEAYSEACLWVIISIIVLALVIASRCNPLVQSIQGTNKWMTLFLLLALASVVYSQSPVFTFVWWFKLALAVVLLQWICAQVRNAQQILHFLRVTWLAFAFLTIMPVVEALLFSESFFQGGRINALVHPVTVSERGAMLLLLSLIIRYTERRRGAAVFGILGTAVMCLGGGKMAMLAGALAAALLILALNRSIKASRTVLTISAVALCTVVLTPVSNYLNEYVRYGETDTLTGRIDLWRDALPLIWQKPLLGHGYMTSRFIGLQVDATYNPGHLHNFCLDVLYCTGAIGLLLILLLITATLVNIIRTMRCYSYAPTRLIAAALFCVTINQLLNGITEANIGGRPSSVFMLLLAITGLSRLLPVASRPAELPLKRDIAL